MAKLIKENDKRWVWRGTFEERLIAKDAGFIWDGLNKVWYTYDDGVANKLAEYMEFSEPSSTVITDANRASYATDSDFYPPVPDGLSYHPYQRAGIEYLVDHKGVLLADQPGMGKTIQVAGAMNTLFQRGELGRVLIIAPASMLITWERELKKWLIWDADIHVFLPGVKKDLPHLGEYEISIFSYERLCTAYKDKYEIQTVKSKKTLIKLDANCWSRYDTVIMDEAHYCKSEESKRTLVSSAFIHCAKRRIFMTGTPMLNRPIELWPLLNGIDPVFWANREAYATYFCNRHLQKVYYKTRTGSATYKQVWMETGARHIDELNESLRMNCMIRRRKEDVLTQLPPKIVQTIELPVDLKDVAEEMEAWHRLCSAYGEAEAIDKLVGNGNGADMKEMAKIRQNVALAKVPYVAEIVENFIEQGEKVVLMAHHIAVVEALMNALKNYHPVKVVGGMTAAEKQKSVDAFQNDVDTKVFIGNIRAAGVGITLTASSTVVFAELDYTPGVMEQCMDRTHRVGQTKTVNVYYVVLNGSLDSYLLEMLRHKENIADMLLA